MANEVTDVKIRVQLVNNAEDQVYHTYEVSGIEANPGGTTPTTDRRILPIMEMSGVDIGPDDKVLVSAYPTASTNFDTNSDLEIPITVLNTTTKVAKPSVLQRADIYTADQAMTTGQWNRIGAYTVPRQQRLVLGKKIAENSRIRAVVRTA
jgi:hypothetical protein